MPPDFLLDVLGVIAVITVFMAVFAVSVIVVRFVWRRVAAVESGRSAMWQVLLGVLFAIGILLTFQYVNTRDRRRQEEAMVAVREWARVLVEMRQQHACTQPPPTRRGPCVEFQDTPSDAPLLSAVRRAARSPLPPYDPWGTAFSVSGTASHLLIRCAGSDRRFERVLRGGPVAAQDPTADLIWEDGIFVQYTEGTPLPDASKYRNRWSSRRAGAVDLNACAACHRQ